MGRGVLASANFDLPNSALPDDVKDKINRDNVKEQQRVAQGTGTNILINLSSTTSTTANLAAYTTIFGFEQAFVCSGGWVDIEAKIPIELDDGESCEMQLLLDGTQVDYTKYAISGGGMDVKGELNYSAFIPKGSHTVTVKAKTSAAIIFSIAGGRSWFLAKETLI